MNTTGKDRLTVMRDGEEVEVFNHVSVSTNHYVNSVNGFDTFEADIAKGDLGRGAQPEAVTKRVATLLYDEFDVEVEDLGIEVIDPEDDEVHIL